MRCILRLKDSLKKQKNKENQDEEESSEMNIDYESMLKNVTQKRVAIRNNNNNNNNNKFRNFLKEFSKENYFQN